MKSDPRVRPPWHEAFEFKEESVSPVHTALSKALKGQASFDVRNQRTSRFGRAIEPAQSLRAV